MTVLTMEEAIDLTQSIFPKARIVTDGCRISVTRLYPGGELSNLNIDQTQVFSLLLDESEAVSFHCWRENQKKYIRLVFEFSKGNEDLTVARIITKGVMTPKAPTVEEILREFPPKPDPDKPNDPEERLKYIVNKALHEPGTEFNTIAGIDRIKRWKTIKGIAQRGVFPFEYEISEPTAGTGDITGFLTFQTEYEGGLDWLLSSEQKSFLSELSFNSDEINFSDGGTDLEFWFAVDVYADE